MLKKENRIRKQLEFDRFFGMSFKRNNGLNLSSPLMLLKLIKSKTKTSRFGFVISKKIDNRASVRNLIKRRLREITRLHLAEIKIPVDALIVVKSAIKDKEYKEIEVDVLRMLRSARVL